MVILMMESTLLKDLAAELNVFVLTSTQISGDIEQVKGIRNQNCLRGSKAIADKVDVGMVTAKVTQEELNLLSSIASKFGIRPNQVTDIYKNRRGRWNDVRVWSYSDLGTCRKKDLFITDASLNEIEGFSPMEFAFDLNNAQQVTDILKLLNTGEATEAIVDTFEDKEINLYTVESEDNRIAEMQVQVSVDNWGSLL